MTHVMFAVESRMPELPEVETVVRDLRPLIVGRTIPGGVGRLEETSATVETGVVETDHSSTHQVAESPRQMDHADLQQEPKLLLHLGMTGQLTVHDLSEPLADHVHFRFSSRTIANCGSATRRFGKRRGLQDFAIAQRLSR